MIALTAPARSTGTLRGLFGRKLDNPAAGVGEALPMDMSVAPTDPGGRGMFGGGSLTLPEVKPADVDLSAVAAHTQNGIANARRRVTWDEVGGWRDRLESLAGAFMMAGGNEQGAFLQNQVRQRRQDFEQTQRAEALREQARAWAVEDRDARMNAPDFFMSGRDRVKYDPRTGQSSVVYQGMDDSESYAAGLGYERGTPEYQTAMQDYVLRGNGPTAYGYDVDLENARQSGRERMEGMRQSNRINLRGMPTYRDTHPRRSGGGGGGGRAARVPTMAGTMAPILGKVAAGQTLTPGEQQAWSMYRSGRTRGGSGGGAMPAASPAASGGLPQPKSRADYQRLPKGAKFIDPNGSVRVK